MRMESSVCMPKKAYPAEYTTNEESIHLNVYTSKACMFHEETMKRVQSIAREFACHGHNIRVMTHSIEDCEENNIVALPTLIIENTQIIGLPTREELSELLRRCIPPCGLDLQ